MAPKHSGTSDAGTKRPPFMWSERPPRRDDPWRRGGRDGEVPAVHVLGHPAFPEGVLLGALLFDDLDGAGGLVVGLHALRDAINIAGGASTEWRHVSVTLPGGQRVDAAGMLSPLDGYPLTFLLGAETAEAAGAYIARTHRVES